MPATMQTYDAGSSSGVRVRGADRLQDSAAPRDQIVFLDALAVAHARGAAMNRSRPGSPCRPARPAAPAAARRRLRSPSVSSEREAPAPSSCSTPRCRRPSPPASPRSPGAPRSPRVAGAALARSPAPVAALAWYAALTGTPAGASSACVEPSPKTSERRAGVLILDRASRARRRPCARFPRSVRA